LARFLVLHGVACVPKKAEARFELMKSLCEWLCLIARLHLLTQRFPGHILGETAEPKRSELYEEPLP
jgi:hypothetical protein